jgi:diaminohydroxyphosphoribosylaminopyrimidine deaminase/5-amino-6-(5-phosphoribosylamino)uracil reductase
LKAALSVDGKLAPPNSARTEAAPHWVTGTAARQDAQQLRHAADAILTGIGTVLADDPSLTDRTGLPRRRPLLRIVLDSQLRTPLDSKLVTTDAEDLLIVCSNDASADRAAALLARGVEILRVHESQGHLNLTEAFAALTQRNILSVLVEAGSSLNSSLLRADLVDKLVLYYAEHELGVDAIPFAADYDSPYAIQQRLTATTRAAFTNGDAEDIRIAGYLHDPWTGIST